MNRRDFLLASGLGAFSSQFAWSDDPLPRPNMGLLLYSYGLRSKAEKDQGFSDPIHFLEFAVGRGANAVQLPLGIRELDECTRIRHACDRLQMVIEGIVSPPREGPAELDRFTREIQTARDCGASLVRTVMLGGRRYEVFEKPDQFPEFAARSEKSLLSAEPIARRHRVALAVENHKDFRVDELVDLLKRASSEWIGVCLDTGNNLALLEDPLSVIEALAPLTRSVHLKDIGIQNSSDGFLMSEVPLGEGVFDLALMVATVRKANPQARFHLEMITRDPLSIPCLTEKYWRTMPRVPGSDLARTLLAVRNRARPTPLPRITNLAADKQLLLEEQHVRRSFAFAATQKLVPFPG